MIAIWEERAALRAVTASETAIMNWPVQGSRDLWRGDAGQTPSPPVRNIRATPDRPDKPGGELRKREQTLSWDGEPITRTVFDLETAVGPPLVLTQSVATPAPAFEYPNPADSMRLLGSENPHRRSGQHYT
jgi:hypothetical protein